jgi:hypothetical protein
MARMFGLHADWPDFQILRVWDCTVRKVLRDSGWAHLHRSWHWAMRCCRRGAASG